MIKLYGHKDEKSHKNVFPDEQLLQYKAWWADLKDGAKICVTYKLDRQQKSWNQVKNHFGNAMMKIVREFDERGWDASIVYRMDKPMGVPVNMAMLQEFFYAIFPTHDDDSKLITMSNEHYTTIHCSEFFENIRNYAASQWSIQIPDPNINWKDEAK